jgi:hypothetical protein
MLLQIQVGTIRMASKLQSVPSQKKIIFSLSFKTVLNAQVWIDNTIITSQVFTCFVCCVDTRYLHNSELLQTLISLAAPINHGRHTPLDPHYKGDTGQLYRNISKTFALSTHAAFLQHGAIHFIQKTHSTHKFLN